MGQKHLLVEAFIPDWPGPKQHAKQIAEVVGKHCPVTILDDPNDYFNAQWERARSLFKGEVLLWIMADVNLSPNFDAMYAEMLRLLGRGDIGWVAPDVSWTCYYYHKQDLRMIENEVYEVPNTDSLCFMIRGDVVRALPYMDSNLSYMWGMDFTAAAKIQMMGLKMVRDYRFKVTQPNSTGYDIDKAGLTMYDLWGSFDESLRKAIGLKVKEANNLKRWPPDAA